MPNPTTSQPLASSEQSKVFIFGLLLVPTLFFVGVIPILFLAFGVWMLKRNQDFSYIETAVRNMRAYYFLVFVGLLLLSGVFAYKYGEAEPDYWRRDDNLGYAVGWGIAAAIALGYFVLAKVLLLNPMRGHEKWIEANGIFSTKPKVSAADKQAEVSIVHGGPMSPSYSVADELIKWSKLKDEGHITLEQYNAAKDKLLSNPSA